MQLSLKNQCTAKLLYILLNYCYICLYSIMYFIITNNNPNVCCCFLNLKLFMILFSLTHFHISNTHSHIFVYWIDELYREYFPHTFLSSYERRIFTVNRFALTGAKRSSARSPASPSEPLPWFPGQEVDRSAPSVPRRSRAAASLRVPVCSRRALCCWRRRQNANS